MKNRRDFKILSQIFKVAPCVLVLGLFVTRVQAQEDQSESTAVKAESTTTTTTRTRTTTKVKERKAILNFEDELVEGSTQKPELFYLFQKKNFNYNRLIKLRENFLPEMRQTTEHVQRVRGGN